MGFVIVVFGIISVFGKLDEEASMLPETIGRCDRSRSSIQIGALRYADGA